ncbi:hypothetical protein HHK36_032990 [Tetracentron sinense]|uniref:Uncharacterized protein n=1 Tax=Tetracentron sinense TaxID=13715 RepID=A0A834Y799_TETSI|nr:hypothetical protein HHK36_032990 [Tetracentron sinense]
MAVVLCSKFPPNVSLTLTLSLSLGFFLSRLLSLSVSPLAAASSPTSLLPSLWPLVAGHLLSPFRLLVAGHLLRSEQRYLTGISPATGLQICVSSALRRRTTTYALDVIVPASVDLL